MSEAFSNRSELNESMHAAFRASGREIHGTAIEKGFWPKVEDRTPDTYVAKMMLLTSEVAEVMEAYRKGHGAEAIVEELADVYIRLVDLYEGMKEAGLLDSIPFDVIVCNKMEKNKARPRKHGNLI